MTRRSTLLLSLMLWIPGCSSRVQEAPDPGNPTPVAGPGPGPAAPRPSGPPARDGTGGLPAGGNIPGRAKDAPLVRIREALADDSLLGRRVRVSGRCTGAGQGRRAGSWTLADHDSSIEVRGLVPPSCSPQSTVELTIFAQVEPVSSGSKERLLLRLPD